MKIADVPIALAAFLLAAPAFAADTATPVESKSDPGFFGRVLNIFDSSPATPNAGNAPADKRPKATTPSGVEPATMEVGSADTDDKDSYKPDAGDAEH